MINSVLVNVVENVIYHFMGLTNEELGRLKRGDILKLEFDLPEWIKEKVDADHMTVAGAFICSAPDSDTVKKKIMAVSQQMANAMCNDKSKIKVLDLTTEEDPGPNDPPSTEGGFAA